MYADYYIEVSSQPYRTHLFMLDFSASSILFDNNVSFSFIKCLFSLWEAIFASKILMH